MSFFTEKHFAFVTTFRSSEGSASARQVLAYGGTYTLTDSLVEATILQAHDEAMIGQTLRWLHKTEANIATYEAIDADGQVVRNGKVKRLE